MINLNPKMGRLQSLLMLLAVVCPTTDSITVTVVSLPKLSFPQPTTSNNLSNAPFFLPLRSEAPLVTKLAGCPSNCVCSHTTVICTGQDLTSVPGGIPSTTTRLDL